MKLIKPLGNNRGFSFMELIIYIAIFAIFLMVIVNIFSIIVSGSAKEEARVEVGQNLRFAVEKITDEMHSASDITQPAIDGTSGNVLILTVNGIPTQFDISDGTLQKTKGAIAENITSDKVVVDVSSDIFSRVGNINAKPAIQIILTISYNDRGRPYYKFRQTIQTTVSLRK